jgi:phosphoglycerate kinase
LAVLGGERAFGRLHGLQGLVLRADKVLLGGAMALPMLQAVGMQPSQAPSQEFFWECRNIMGLAGRVHHQIMLPQDLVWWRLDGSVEVTPFDAPGGDDVVDIGPLTRRRFDEVLGGARTVLWVGALGRVEDVRFAEGTRAVASSLPADASTMFGGDGLVGLLDAERLLPAGADVLSATDAAIELLKNGDLPALAALRRRRREDGSTRGH